MTDDNGFRYIVEMFQPVVMHLQREALSTAVTRRIRLVPLVYIALMYRDSPAVIRPKLTNATIPYFAGCL